MHYPACICYDCAVKNGGKLPKGYLAIWHVDECGWCKENKAVTQAKDYGFGEVPTVAQKKHFCINPSKNSRFMYCETIGNDVCVRVDESWLIVKFCPFCGESTEAR